MVNGVRTKQPTKYLGVEWWGIRAAGKKDVGLVGDVTELPPGQS